MVPPSPPAPRARPARRTLRALLGAFHAFHVGLLAWAALHALDVDGGWALFLVDSFAHLAFGLALLAAPVAWFAGGAALRASLVVVLAVGAVTAGPVWNGAPAERDPPGALRVMTYNVNVETRDADAVIAVLERADPDIVVLQEMNPVVAEAIEARLGERWPHRIFFATFDWGGTGIASRYPLEHRRDERLPGSSYRNPLIVDVNLPDGPATVVGLHLTGNPRDPAGWPGATSAAIAEREQRALEMVDLAAARGRPVIVLGDFNTTERSRTHALMERGFRDAWLAAGRGFGFTYPGGALRLPVVDAPLPTWLLRIDYVFASPHWRVLDARVAPWDGVSDHRAVVATLLRADRSPDAAGR